MGGECDRVGCVGVKWGEVAVGRGGVRSERRVRPPQGSRTAGASAPCASTSGRRAMLVLLLGPWRGRVLQWWVKLPLQGMGGLGDTGAARRLRVG